MQRLLQTYNRINFLLVFIILMLMLYKDYLALSTDNYKNKTFILWENSKKISIKQKW